MSFFYIRNSILLFQIGFKAFKLDSYSNCFGPKDLNFGDLYKIGGIVFRVCKDGDSKMCMVAQATNSSFNLPWYSKIRPSKSLWDLDSLCCVSRQFVFWDTNIDPCLWCGTCSKEGERRWRKNSSPLSVTGLLWCLLERKPYGK